MLLGILEKVEIFRALSQQPSTEINAFYTRAFYQEIGQLGRRNKTWNQLLKQHTSHYSTGFNRLSIASVCISLVASPASNADENPGDSATCMTRGISRHGEAKKMSILWGMLHAACWHIKAVPEIYIWFMNDSQLGSHCTLSSSYFHLVSIIFPISGQAIKKQSSSDQTVEPNFPQLWPNKFRPWVNSPVGSPSLPRLPQSVKNSIQAAPSTSAMSLKHGCPGGPALRIPSFHGVCHSSMVNNIKITIKQ